MSNGDSLLKYVTPWRVFAAVVLAFTLYIVYQRFAVGLGAVTNLADVTPWGMWVGFDILAGVALAAGGFVMAGGVYVFHLKKYKPLVRMAILTAMLGYLLFVVGLILEIGRPWNMVQIFVSFNFRSPLFEVAWCVVLYTTVLILEFSLVVFERLGWKRFVRLHHQVSVGLVILGIGLSTLHQSTLGTLFTIAQHKMHPLWFTPLQNVTFFISCVAAGLGMVTFEAFLSYRFNRHRVRMDLLTGLMRVMAGVLLLYGVYRFAELGVRGALPLAFEPGFAAFMFWLENLLFVFFPLVVIFRKGRAIQPLTLFFVAFSVVLGLIMHRFNVAITSFQTVHDTGYFPSGTEVWVSTALVVGGFIAAGLAVYLFPMHPHEKVEEVDDGMIRIPWKTGEKAS